MPVRASAQAVTSTRMRITPRGCQTSESDLAAIANTPAPAKLDGVVITESNRAWKPGPPQRPGRALAWYLTASDGRRKTPATGALRLMHG